MTCGFSTGHTLAQARRLGHVQRRGRDHDAAVVHALFDAPAVERAAAAGIRRTWSTDAGAARQQRRHGRPCWRGQSRIATERSLVPYAGRTVRAEDRHALAVARPEPGPISASRCPGARDEHGSCLLARGHVITSEEQLRRIAGARRQRRHRGRAPPLACRSRRAARRPVSLFGPSGSRSVAVRRALRKQRGRSGLRCSGSRRCARAGRGATLRDPDIAIWLTVRRDPKRLTICMRRAPGFALRALVVC